jgi:lipopolysaccharide transport system permease protein
MYVRRDIVTQYKQTILGPLWYIIQPLFTTIMYMFVFGGLAGISTDGAPQPLFYMAGIVLWGYFNECFTVSSDVFGVNANVFGKVYFPRLIVPLSGVTSGLLKMLIQLCIFIVIYLYYVLTLPAGTLQINASLLLFPVLIFMLAMHGMSWGLIISSMTTKYRDMKFLVQFGIQLFMYATPVIYPLSTISNDTLRIVMQLNPLTGIVEFFKYGMLGVGNHEWWMLGYSFGFMVVLLAVGIVVFNKVQKSFMDTV